MAYHEILEKVVGALEAKGVTFDEGLRDAEIEAAQRRFGFRFPSDLREFLQLALPISSGFPDWRHDSVEVLSSVLEAPCAGICFDVERNRFWLPSWGTKPNDLSGAIAFAREEVAKAPRLIPVYGHRYLPGEPCEPGNPVLSVVQTDIIHYGHDLCSYLAHEFKFPPLEPVPREPRRIRFWSELVG